jgi:hypothetical protein
MTARHSALFTLESGQSVLRIYTSQRDAAQGADLQQRCQRGVVVNLPAVVRGWASAPLLALPLAGEAQRLEAADAIGLFGRLILLPLAPLRQPERPVERLEPEPVPLQGIAESLSQLQRLGGLVGVGKSGADAVLL